MFALALLAAPSLVSGADLPSIYADIAAVDRSGDGLITLDADITLTEALSPITGSVTIDGNGHTISGGGAFRHFAVNGGQLTVRNATLADGFSPDEDGGSILAREGAEIILENVAFINNETGRAGGAIATASGDVRLRVSDSAFTANKAGTGGGAIIINGGTAVISGSAFRDNVAAHHGGALEALNGQARIENSTFALNAAPEAGGILISGASVTMTHLTVMDNEAHTGGGIHRRGGVARLRNSVVAGGGDALNCTGGLDESEGNFSQDGTCALRPGGEPLLGDLTGAPAYYALLDGSPAVDAAASDYCLDLDQRGEARPQGGGCDIGAIEWAGAAPAEATPVPEVCALADQILAANTNRAVGACPAGTSHDIIRLTEDIVLTEPLPLITGTITIEGNGHTISGDDRFQIFVVTGPELTIKDLTLTGGYAGADGGAMLLGGGGRVVLENVTFVDNVAQHGGALSVNGFRGSLEVKDSVFMRNSAVTGGGAILWNGGALTVAGSAFIANSAESWGGAIETLNGSASISNSTFAENEGGSGGAILVSGASTTMTHLTLVDNSSLWGEGDAIHVRGGIADLRNSIVAGGADSAQDCTGVLRDRSGNISEDGSCALLPGGDPMLAEITGSPAYFTLLDGSPAVDGADAEFCLPTDQIGTPRPLGGGCDAGAFESATATAAAATPVPSECTLFDQILAANTNRAVGACPAGTSHDIIRLTEDITLSEPLPEINGTITIEGDGHTISGDYRFRIFRVRGRKLTINNLRLTRARAEGSGGAILVQNDAELVVNNSIFERNRVEYIEDGNRLYGGYGGAIGADRFSGRISVNQSAFNSNEAAIGGGAMSVSGGTVDIRGSAFTDNNGQGLGGAIEISGGQASIENSTFSRNRSYNGAIYITGGSVTMTHLTMLNNASSGGDGAAINVWDGSARLRNSVVSSRSRQPDCHGSISKSGNFSDDGTCAAAEGDNPLLGDLAGAPGYFPPLEDSPLVDAADAEFCLATDQLGMARPAGDGCDIGAVELGGERAAAQAISSDESALSACQVTTTHNLNFREEPAGARIGLVSGGASFTLLSRTAGWIQIEHGGQEGWISADYVTLAGDCGAEASSEASALADEPSEGTLSDCRVTTTHGLNLRDSAGVRIGIVPAGTTLDAVARVPGWFNVRYDGALGWISADYVTLAGDCA